MPIKRLEFSEELLRQLYIEENKSMVEIEKILNVGSGSLFPLLKKYNIVKPKSLVQQNRERNNLLKYGVANTSKLESSKLKSKETMMARYGVEHALQSDEFKDKALNTIKDRYGSLSNEDILERRKQTMLDRYGVEHQSHLASVQDKIKQTSLERYGATSYLASEGNRERLRSEDILSRANESRKKSQQTRLLKSIATNLNKYGVAHISQRHIPKETLETVADKGKFEAFILSNTNRTFINLARMLHVGTEMIRAYVNKYNLQHLVDTRSSSYELDLKKILEDNGLKVTKSRQVIKPLEVDLYIEDKRVGIEMNGDYWHSTLFVDKNYHQHKSLLAEQNDIFIYHVFEHEWLDSRKHDLIISQIFNVLGLNKRRLFARKTIIKEIDSKTCGDFLNNNHIQGADKSRVKLGLFSEDELVAVMTFCKPRFNKHFDWELSRFCTLCGTTVVGGASKLFKHFINNYEGSIISYSDIAKTRGNIYSALRFELVDITTPNYKWIKNNEVLTRYQCQMKNEKEIMTQKGFYQVFDSGSRVWAYKR